MPNQSLEPMKTAFLVERGECTFSLKSNNIKLAGGDLAMIYLSDTKDDLANIVPVADKKFRTSNLPTVLITLEAGLALKKTLVSEQKKVIISVDFDMPKSAGKPKVDFWMSPHD